MRETLTFTVDEALPPPSRLLRDQGLPSLDRLSPRLHSGLEDAVALFRSLAEPRAVIEEVDGKAIEGILAALGALDEAPVVARILPRARAFALYVATLGEPLSVRVHDLFAGGDLALGWTLDAVASSAADRLADLLSDRFRERIIARGETDTRVLPYGPGYCGWPTRGQAPLFARLHPDEVGVHLTDSFLMLPIKSVSGILLAGDSRTHVFDAAMDFCASCTTHACDARMASVTD